MDTKELLDEFFTTKKAKSRITARSTLIDNEKLYHYETKIGKKFIEMDCEELIDLVDVLASKKNMYNINTLSYPTVNGIVIIMSDIFNYYIGTGHTIVNFFTQQERMSSANIYRELCQRYSSFTWDYVQRVLDTIRLCESAERANYYELIIRLFYDGVLSIGEIINLKEDMINYETKTITFQQRIIKIDERCCELLIAMNKCNFQAVDTRFVWANWRGNYFKYYIRNKEYNHFDDRDEKKMAETLNGFISRINRKISEKSENAEDVITLDTVKVARLGFYDNLVKKYGLERTNAMLTSSRVSQDVNDLMEAARIYGFTNPNPTNLKNNLKPYIRLR